MTDFLFVSCGNSIRYKITPDFAPNTHISYLNMRFIEMIIKMQIWGSYGVKMIFAQ